MEPCLQLKRFSPLARFESAQLRRLELPGLPLAYLPIHQDAGLYLNFVKLTKFRLAPAYSHAEICKMG